MIATAAGGAIWWLNKPVGEFSTVDGGTTGPALSAEAVFGSFFESELAADSGLIPSLGIAITDKSGTL